MKEENKQILLGSVLGDGGIYINKKCKNPHYAEKHSVKQKDYLLWKIENLSYDLGEFKTYKYESNGHTLFEGWTKVNPFLKKFKSEFEEISEELNDLGFLVWYLDDGNFNYFDNCLRLSTKEYPNKLIVEWGKEKLDIEFKISRENVLKLNVSHTKKLISKLIHTFEKYNLPKCMEYKLGLDEERRKEAREKKKEYQKKYYEENRGKDTKREPNWTDEEIEILKNKDMTIKELSEILDRTKKSIYSKKYRLKKKEGKGI